MRGLIFAAALSCACWSQDADRGAMIDIDLDYVCLDGIYDHIYVDIIVDGDRVARSEEAQPRNWCTAWSGHWMATTSMRDMIDREWRVVVIGTDIYRGDIVPLGACDLRWGELERANWYDTVVHEEKNCTGAVNRIGLKLRDGGSSKW